MTISEKVITGCCDAHLVEWRPKLFLHKQAVAAWEALQHKALEHGFGLRIASAYRSFERQLLIWNEKASGKRNVLNSHGKLIVSGELNDEELMWAMLRWSALPGTSRHHWGTDFDIFDANAVDENYRLQLVVDEYIDGGPFFTMTAWLDKCIEAQQTDYYRPYNLDRGGVAPEPWHISYRPLADQFQQQLTPQVVRRLIEQSDIQLKEQILQNLPEIMDRFVIGC